MIYMNQKFNYSIAFDYSYAEERYVISGKDYSDQFNLPAFFTLETKGIEEAFKELLERYQGMFFDEVIKFLNDKNLKVYCYCINKI